MSLRPSRSEKDIGARNVGGCLPSREQHLLTLFVRQTRQEVTAISVDDTTKNDSTNQGDEMEGRRGSKRVFILRRAYLRCDEREVRRCGNVSV